MDSGGNGDCGRAILRVRSKDAAGARAVSPTGTMRPPRLCAGLIQWRLHNRKTEQCLLHRPIRGSSALP